MAASAEIVAAPRISDEDLFQITDISQAEADQFVYSVEADHAASDSSDYVLVRQQAPDATAYRFVDSIPEVAAERQVVRRHAESVLETNRKRAAADQSLELISVDALSTADDVLEAERTYGFESPERKERWKGLVLDCDRYIGEWYNKLKPTIFRPIRHKFVEEEQDYYSYGFSSRRMTENALVPIPEDPEEEVCRINERVEDSTLPIMHRLGALAVGEVTRTLSGCTNSAKASYEADMKNGRKHRGYRGYVPEKDKRMIRDAWLDSKTGDRWIEQAAVPGLYHTDEIVEMALERRDLDVSGMTRAELRGAQFIAKDSLMGFIALLDEVASEQWCTNVFMGEEVDADHEKDYEKFREEAYARQESLKDLAETMATFVLDIAESGEISRSDAPEHVEEFVKMLLLDLGKQDKEVAAQMFDENTAEGLQQVARLEAAGEYERAEELMREVREAAPGGGSCGAGSCGLEAVGQAEEKSLREKLKATDKDKLVRDKERACTNCGKKSIVYAYNDSKVSKYCEGCKASETKYTKPQ